MALIINRRRLLAAGAALGFIGLPGRAQAPARSGFTHGVASGDPGQTSITLWTRYVGGIGPSRLKAEVAEDPGFQHITSTGETEASPAFDSCAHAHVDGLKPNRWYHYRFVAPGGEISAVGRTRTLPGAGVDRFRIAVFSCSNGTSGWFNAYAHAAAREDIDLALHLGDYIYESPVTRSDAAPGLAQKRGLAPPGEIIALADYRLRYASYRADPDLAELHRRLPMIAVWDDHETANNSWETGADAHNPQTEGDWAARKAAGVRAWQEWLPTSRQAWYDSYQIGDLATLFRLETRLLGRTKQLDDDLNTVLAAGGADLSARLSAFGAGPLASPARSMMGAAQERWLADGLKASVASNARWQILAQQVIMGATRFPKAGAQWVSGAMTPELQADLDARNRLTAAGLPYSLDKWDGYPAARQRLYDSARAARANLVTLTGDSHNAWAFDLGDKAGAVGVEFAGQSVSSFGFERRFNGDASRIAADFIAANPALKWMDASQRGYFTLDITRDRIEAEYVFVPAVGARSTTVAGRRTLSVAHGARRLSV
jgi:alkaline phosphatase D